MAPFFPLFGERNVKSTPHKPNISATQEIYDDDGSDTSAEDREIFTPFMPRDNLKTNFACVAFSCLSHYLYGIFFNAYESVNTRYDYPNIGSMCFVMATAIILVRFDLSLKSLRIEAGTWKYSMYKVLAVAFITHLVLAGIWQQLVNLTWELFFVCKDFLEFLNSYSDGGILHMISSRMTTRVVNVLTYLEGMFILAIVLLSHAD